MLTFKIGTQRYTISAKGRDAIRATIMALMFTAGFCTMATIGRVLVGE